MDTMSPEERSKHMGRVRSKDTKPELRVRRLIHRLGYRYRLHRKDLPGAPDLVFGPRRKVVFVHGCFWHRHEGCKLARMPKSKLDFWAPKLELNRTRDVANLTALQELGWDSLVVWECEIRDEEALLKRIVAHLEE